MNIKKIISYILFSSLLIQVHAGFALTYKLSLLTKKLPGGKTHCIWNIHLAHESYLSLDHQTKSKIVEKDLNDIIKFAKQLNAIVYAEDMSHYNKKTKILNYLYSKTHIKTSPDLLNNIYKRLQKHNINTHNVEQRQDIKNLLPLIYILPLIIKGKLTHKIIRKLINTIIPKSFCGDGLYHDFRICILPLITNLLVNKTINYALYPLISKLFGSSTTKHLNTTKTMFIYTTISLSITLYLSHLSRTKKIHTKIKNNKYKNILSDTKEDFETKYRIIAHLEDKPLKSTLLSYSYLNDIETIIKLLNQENESPSSNADYIHSFFLLGYEHSKAIEEALLHNFKYKKEYDISSDASNPYLLNKRNKLNIEECILKGLEILKIKIKKEKEKEMFQDKKRQYISTIMGTQISSDVEKTKVKFLAQRTKGFPRELSYRKILKAQALQKLYSSLLNRR